VLLKGFVMELKNLTPHPVRLVRPDGEVVVLQPAGFVPRVAEVPGTPTGEVMGIPIYSPSHRGAIENLPAPQPEVFLIVSGVVAAACGDRSDVLRPGTGPQDNAVREDGRVVGVTRLIATYDEPTL